MRDRGALQDREIVRRWDRGDTMATIARSLGISRERVRQRLERSGRRGRQTIVHASTEALRRAAEDSHSLHELANSLSLPVHRVAQTIERLGLGSEVALTLARNRYRRAHKRRSVDRPRAILAIRSLAKQLGCTPRIVDLRNLGFTRYRLQQLFGSARQAAIAALLEPNPRGGLALLPPDFCQNDPKGESGMQRSCA